MASYAYSYRGDVTAIGSAATIAYDANDHVTQTVDASGASGATATVVSDEVAPSGRVLHRLAPGALRPLRDPTLPEKRDL